RSRKPLVASHTDASTTESASMGRRWIRWMHKRGLRNWVIPSAIVFATLLKLCLGLSSYSGALSSIHSLIPTPVSVRPFRHRRNMTDWAATCIRPINAPNVRRLRSAATLDGNHHPPPFPRMVHIRSAVLGPRLPAADRLPLLVARVYRHAHQPHLV